MEGYQAAREQVAVARLDGWGWLRVTGRDRLDLLQRLSTNDLRELTAGEGRPTCLLSGTGRMMALVTVAVTEEAVYLRTEPGQTASVARYLNKMIFYNDEVQVVDASGESAQWGVYGPAAGNMLADLGALLAAPAYAWLAAHAAGRLVKLQRGGPLLLPAWIVVAGAADVATVDEALVGAAGARLDAEALELLRVEAGIPAWGRELNDNVTPLEAGLISAISFSKGCYTGQEVVARQYNYHKIPRQLAGLLLPAQAGTDLAGAAVRAQGTAGGRPGFVGTAVQSPTLGRPIALAVVPQEVAGPGSRVLVTGPTGELEATAAALPFI